MLNFMNQYFPNDRCLFLHIMQLKDLFKVKNRVPAEAGASMATPPRGTAQLTTLRGLQSPAPTCPPPPHLFRLESGLGRESRKENADGERSRAWALP